MKLGGGLVMVPVGMLFLIFITVFRPISQGDVANSIRVLGFVDSIEFDLDTKDVGISLRNDDHYYYINRGLEKGDLMNKISNSIQGETVEVYFADHWTILDPKSESRHITKIVHDNEVLYKEMVD